MSAAGDALSPEINARLDAVSTMLALPESRVSDIRSRLISDAYTRLLRTAVRNGTLDSSASPATVLNTLLMQVRFVPFRTESKKAVYVRLWGNGCCYSLYLPGCSSPTSGDSHAEHLICVNNPQRCEKVYAELFLRVKQPTNFRESTMSVSSS